MTENTDVNKGNSFEKQNNKEEMKKMVISFVLMIIFTLVSFGVVAFGGIQSMFVIPLLLIMAIVQVAFQFYYFMHMKDKGHEFPSLLIYGGVWAALLTLSALILISWW